MAGAPNLIGTVWGRGYMIRADSEMKQTDQRVGEAVAAVAHDDPHGGVLTLSG